VLEGLQSTPAEAPTAEVPVPAPEGDLLPPAASQPAASQPAAEAPSTTPATPSAPAAPKQ